MSFLISISSEEIDWNNESMEDKENLEGRVCHSVTSVNAVKSVTK